MNKKTIMKQFAKVNWSLITVHWKGSPVMVKVRKPSDLEIQAIGAFSLIDLGENHAKQDWRTIEKNAAMLCEIAKAALVTPTYKELFGYVGNCEFQEEKKKQLIEIEKELISMPKGPEKKLYETRLALLKVQVNLILPSDFIREVADYAMSVGETNVNLVTKDILLDCYFCFKQFGGRPSDYCSDPTFDLNTRIKKDIDVRAMHVGADYEKANSKRGKK
jgi:hypothetical protein